ncbi:MAG TPA: formylglycine-generating enzyme family protein [Steroidobacteraceae bacterium]|nr:formylglycine-generating enzyme family protein [Steroidobacteraceae bacterium]
MWWAILAATLAAAAMPVVRADDAARCSSGSAAYVTLPGGEFHSILPPAAAVQVEPFSLERTPVTNRAFLEFVRAHPEWQRDRVAPKSADGRYLEHWQSPLELGAGAPSCQPVTRVSWFAARAYCESRGARLPTWLEWEFAAAADEHVADARRDPLWRQTILATLGRARGAPLPAVGLKPPNLYGIQDLHGLVWEWVEDFDTLFMAHAHPAHAGMTMAPGDTAMSCGAAALSVTDPENYPMILRLAVLSALNRSATTADLGFRCAIAVTRHE